MYIQHLSTAHISLGELSLIITTYIPSPAPPSLVKTVAISPATYRRRTCARHRARYWTCRTSVCRDRSLGPGRNPLLSDFSLLVSWGIPWHGHVGRAARQTCLPMGSSVVKITHHILSLARATFLGRATKTSRRRESWDLPRLGAVAQPSQKPGQNTTVIGIWVYLSQSLGKGFQDELWSGGTFTNSFKVYKNIIEVMHDKYHEVMKS